MDAVLARTESHGSVRTSATPLRTFDIAHHLSPAAAAKTVGLIDDSIRLDGGRRECVAEEWSVEVQIGGAAGEEEETSAGPPEAACSRAASAGSDRDDYAVSADAHASGGLQMLEELHGAGVVVGFRLWQLFNNLLRYDAAPRV